MTSPSIDRAERWIVLTWATCALLPFLAACASMEVKSVPYFLHPIPPQAREYRLSSGALVFNAEGLEIEVRPMDPRVLDRCLADQGRANPFAGQARVGPGPAVFELRIANGSGDTVNFEPGFARLIDEQGKRFAPIDYPDLLRFLAGDPQRDKKLAAFSAVSFDTLVEIRKGKEAKKYLAFPPSPYTPRQVALHLPLSIHGRAQAELTFLFEAFPDESSAP